MTQLYLTNHTSQVLTHTTGMTQFVDAINTLVFGGNFSITAYHDVLVAYWHHMLPFTFKNSVQ